MCCAWVLGVGDMHVLSDAKRAPANIYHTHTHTHTHTASNTLAQ
jgi:hypothetical protein